MKLKIILLLLFVFFIGCTNEEIINNSEAYTSLVIAILYKSSICNHQPSYFLILPKEMPRRWYEACIFSIIRMNCPFYEYPAACIKIYEKVEE